MKSFFKHALRYLPLALGVVILVIGSLFVPWHQVVPYLKKLTPLSYVLIVGIGTLFYLTRATRYYYMFRVLNDPRSLRRTIVAYFEAQPVSLLPAGEAFRTVTLKKQAKVPLANSVPVVFLQSFTENIGLIVLALVSAVMLKQQDIIIIIAAVVYLVILVLLRTKRTAEQSRQVLNKLPFVNLARRTYHRFIHKNKILLSGRSLLVLLLSGLISSLLASTLLFFVAKDMGIALTYPEAVIAFALPTALQNVTFLPGGIGINEQSSVGILVLLGVHFPAAVALTIIIRMVTLTLGIVLGLGAIALAKIHPRLES